MVDDLDVREEFAEGKAHQSVAAIFSGVVDMDPP